MPPKDISRRGYPTADGQEGYRLEEYSAVWRLRDGPGWWRMLAPLLGYSLPRKGGELPELVGVFGVGYRGVRSRFPRRLDQLKV